MENSRFVGFDTFDDWVRLTLKRPPLNFLNLTMLQEMEDCLTRVENSSRHRALVIDSGVAAFTGGLDLTEHTREQVFLLLEKFHRVVTLLNTIPVPTIAAVRGLALGAGNEIVACCDFVLATEKAMFGQPEIKMGSIPSLAPILLPRIIGHRHASELILTGNIVSAAEARNMGLIHRLINEDEVGVKLDELLQTIRSLSTSVTALALQSTRALRVRDLETYLREVQSLYLDQLMDLEDSGEGVQAFLQKRAPKWKHQ